MTAAAAAEVKRLMGGLRRVRRGIEPPSRELKELCSVPIPDDPRELNLLKVEFKTKLNRLIPGQKSIEAYLVELEGHLAVLESGNVDVPDIGYEDQADFSNSLLDIIARAEAILESIQPTPSAAATPHAFANSQNDNGQNSAIESQFARILELMEHRAQNAPPPPADQSVKLPFIPLPKFSGDLLKWKPFWDRFEASVDKKPGLSPVDKLNYLFGLVVGEPQKMIQNLPLINENYPVAVNLLKQRYGKPKTMVAALYRRFNELASISNEQQKLRFFCSEIECIMGSLDALGQNVNDDHFVSMILSKLPDDLIMVLEHTKKVEDEWTVGTLRKAMSDQIERLDSTARSTSNVPLANAGKNANNGQRFKNQYGNRFDYRKPIHSTGEALVANGNTENTAQRQFHRQNNQQTSNQPFRRPPQRNCIFCQNLHFPDECPKLTTAEARQKAARGRCFNCLGEGHSVRDCRRTKPCFYCGRPNHHSSLCFQQFGTRSQKETTNLSGELGNDRNDQNDANDSAVTAINENATLAAGEVVVLQTAKVVVQDEKHSSNQTDCTILFDVAASRSYITTSLAKTLKLKTRPGPDLSVNTFATDKAITIPTKQSELYVNFDDGTNFRISVTMVPTITGAVMKPPIQLEEVHRVAKKLKIADYLPNRPEYRQIDLLIGNDYYSDIVTGERLQVAEGLYFIGSKIGWILSGRVPQTKADNYSVSMCCPSDSEQHFSSKPQFEDMWSLEAIGIADSPLENDDERASKMFHETIKMEGSRYQVTFPWKEEHAYLPDNYNLSLRRLESTLSKLRKTPELLQKYAAIIEDQNQKGIIERVTDETVQGKKFHYIPHQAVITPTKTTTKVRIVYDGSAKANKFAPSVNDCLLRGPIMLEDLCGLLIRFRMSPIALLADIEKAFLQVGLQVSDRDVTRFLWLKNPAVPTSPNNLQIYRFCRVPFGINSSPFLLNATVQHHLTKYKTEVSNRLSKNIYVDNVVTGVESVEKANTFFLESKQIFHDASMNLREWCSNSAAFMNSISAQDCAKPGPQKVLGISWDPKTDNLSIGSNDFQNVRTKRNLLSAISGIFDPLGLTLPVTVQGKILFQDVCQKNLAWDDPLGEPEIKRWTEMLPHLAGINALPIPRYIGQLGKQTIDLHCFCDASERSYATAVFLRIETPEKTTCNLIFAKSRLNPVKRLTIPKMELLGVWIGVNAINFARTQLALPINSVTLWCDSQCVLAWIASDKPLGRFVANRVKKIRQSEKTVFRYVFTKDNPADLATRGVKPEEVDSLWWHGPPWLISPKSDWPNWGVPEIDPSQLKEKSSGSMHEMSMATNEKKFDKPRWHPPFGIDLSKQPSVIRAWRITAWCLRFISHAQKRDRNPNKSALSVFEIYKAKSLWDLSVQKFAYPEVFIAIQKQKRHCMLNLGLQIDETGILRCHGRLGKAEIAHDAKYPKLVPGNHIYTRKLIEKFHAASGHFGTSHTLNQLRHEYWVPKGRLTVKTVLRDCALCLKHQGYPYPLPKMPELPKSRVVPHPAFQYTGLDYFGPLRIKNKNGSQKAWVCLFTCLSVRAVHLELVMDMTSAEFLLALRRFIARRGKPNFILSDNAPQFKLVKTVVDTAWQETIQSEDIFDYCSSRGIEWSFIPEYAPWHGGIYERMVGIVKSSLKKVLGQAFVNADQLCTILCETESVVNSRPLTYISDEPENFNIITPAHFLTLNPKAGTPNLDIDDDNVRDPDYVPMETTRTNLISFWKKGQHLLNEFWKVWQTDYLASLRERSSYDHPTKRSAKVEPSVGHVVLIKDPLLPRGSWRMGKITKLRTSDDKLVRSAYVQLPSKTVLCRPVNLLYPLELPSQTGNGTPNDSEKLDSGRGTPQVSKDKNDKPSDSTIPLPPPLPNASRPVRKAAVDALNRCRLMLNPPW